jgi:DNA-binding response OmpR family regulator
MGRVRQAPAADVVLLVSAGEASHPAADLDLDAWGIEMRAALPAEAIELLRENPLRPLAILLSGDGRVAAAHAILAALKEAAPRVPVIFLDANPTTLSELAVRRAGVHFYTHVPPNVEELKAVLWALEGVSSRHEETPIAAPMGA